MSACVRLRADASSRGAPAAVHTLQGALLVVFVPLSLSLSLSKYIYIYAAFMRR